MKKVGIVSTSDISKVFCNTVNKIENLDWNISAVYSRDINKAQDYALENDIELCYDSYEEFLRSDIDIVYISSPNAFHYKHCLEAIKFKKHVLVEKPLCLEISHINDLYNKAQSNNVFIMEAVVSLSKKPLNDLKLFLEKQKVFSFDFTFSKQTRHYKNYVNGKYFNVFDKKMGGGSTNDLGVYCAYVMVYLFGKTNNIKSFQKLSENGADESSVSIIKYDNLIGTLKTSKVCADSRGSIISCENYQIEIENIGVVNDVKIYDLKYNLIEHFKCNKLVMENEILHFNSIIQSEKFKSDLYTKKISLEVCEILNIINKNN